VADRLVDAQENIQTSASKAETHVENLIREVWELSTTAEVNLKQMSQQNTRAGELLEAYHQAADPADNVLKGLADKVKEAQALVLSLTQRSDQARDLAKRVSTLSKLVNDVKKIDTSMQERSEKAANIKEQIEKATQSAQQKTTSLQELNTDSHGMIETYELMRMETNLVKEEFLVQMDVSRDTIERSREFTDWFRQQSECIEDKIVDLKQQTNRIETVMVKATARPAEVVAAAQAQSKQLEKVCAAVQKVFRGLSKAALDAKEQTTTCKDTSQQAQERMSKLNQDTQTAAQQAQERMLKLNQDTHTAAQTMHEWVQEAVRVQRRLETTIGQAPSITQTHPTGSLDRLSESVAPAATKIASLKASNQGELEVLSEPGSTVLPEVVVNPAPSKTKNRITQLIEDAKTVVESTGNSA